MNQFSLYFKKTNICNDKGRLYDTNTNRKGFVLYVLVICVYQGYIQCRSYLLGVLVKMNYKSKFEKLLKYRRRSNQINGKFAVKMFVISFTCNY